MLLAALDDADAPGVAAAGDHGERPRVKLEVVRDRVGRDVHHDGVGLLNLRVRVTDGAAVVEVNARHALVAELLRAHLAQLVLGLQLRDAVHDEAALLVVDEPEVLVRLVDGHDVHEPGGVALVDPRLTVHLHEPLHQDRRHLLVRERVLEAVAEDEAQGEALALLVRARARLRGEDAAELVEHPVAGGIEPLEVLLRSARHCEGEAQDGGGRRSVPVGEWT